MNDPVTKNFHTPLRGRRDHTRLLADVLFLIGESGGIPNDSALQLLLTRSDKSDVQVRNLLKELLKTFSDHTTACISGADDRCRDAMGTLAANMLFAPVANDKDSFEPVHILAPLRTPDEDNKCNIDETDAYSDNAIGYELFGRSKPQADDMIRVLTQGAHLIRDVECDVDTLDDAGLCSVLHTSALVVITHAIYAVVIDQRFAHAIGSHLAMNVLRGEETTVHSSQSLSPEFEDLLHGSSQSGTASSLLRMRATATLLVVAFRRAAASTTLEDNEARIALHDAADSMANHHLLIHNTSNDYSHNDAASGTKANNNPRGQISAMRQLIVDHVIFPTASNPRGPLARGVLHAFQSVSLGSFTDLTRGLLKIEHATEQVSLFEMAAILGTHTSVSHRIASPIPSVAMALLTATFALMGNLNIHGKHTEGGVGWVGGTEEPMPPPCSEIPTMGEVDSDDSDQGDDTVFDIDVVKTIHRRRKLQPETEWTRTYHDAIHFLSSIEEEPIVTALRWSTRARFIERERKRVVRKPPKHEPWVAGSTWKSITEAKTAEQCNDALETMLHESTRNVIGRRKNLLASLYVLLIDTSISRAVCHEGLIGATPASEQFTALAVCQLTFETIEPFGSLCRSALLSQSHRDDGNGKDAALGTSYVAFLSSMFMLVSYRSMLGTLRWVHGDMASKGEMPTLSSISSVLSDCACRHINAMFALQHVGGYDFLCRVMTTCWSSVRTNPMLWSRFLAYRGTKAGSQTTAGNRVIRKRPVRPTAMSELLSKKENKASRVTKRARKEHGSNGAKRNEMSQMSQMSQMSEGSEGSEGSGENEGCWGMIRAEEVQGTENWIGLSMVHQLLSDRLCRTHTTASR